MRKIEEKLLEDFKKSNKERKEKLAKKFGFDSADAYLKELKLNLPSAVTSNVTIPKIHNVVLLDNSGSMSGMKFVNAFNGVEQEINELKKETKVNYSYSLFNFTENSTPQLVINNKLIQDVILPRMIPNTGTPLYAAIELIANTLKADPTTPTIKVLVKIFTDGRDEHSKHKKEDAIRAIAAMKKDGITVTFVGTEIDVAFMISDLGIDESNTLVHDNTSEGVRQAFARSMTATAAYTANVIEGKDVSKGFYKNIK